MDESSSNAQNATLRVGSDGYQVPSVHGLLSAFRDCFFLLDRRAWLIGVGLTAVIFVVFEIIWQAVKDPYTVEVGALTGGPNTWVSILGLCLPVALVSAAVIWRLLTRAVRPLRTSLGPGRGIGRQLLAALVIFVGGIAVGFVAGFGGALDPWIGGVLGTLAALLLLWVLFRLPGWIALVAIDDDQGIFDVARSSWQATAGNLAPWILAQLALQTAVYAGYFLVAFSGFLPVAALMSIIEVPLAAMLGVSELPAELSAVLVSGMLGVGNGILLVAVAAATVALADVVLRARAGKLGRSAAAPAEPRGAARWGLLALVGMLIMLLAWGASALLEGYQEGFPGFIAFPASAFLGGMGLLLYHYGSGSRRSPWLRWGVATAAGIWVSCVAITTTAAIAWFPATVEQQECLTRVSGPHDVRACQRMYERGLESLEWMR